MLTRTYSDRQHARGSRFHRKAAPTSAAWLKRDRATPRALHCLVVGDLSTTHMYGCIHAYRGKKKQTNRKKQKTQKETNKQTK
jgi:hypothetical protein